MPTGRATVTRAWRQLPEAVRAGGLSGRGGDPLRRALKPVMRGLFPDVPPSKLVSATAELHEASDDDVVARIVGAAAVLTQLTEVMDQLLATLSERGYRGGDDPPYTAGINAYFGMRDAADDPATPLSLAAVEKLIEQVSAQLVASGATPDLGAEDAAATIAAVNALFRDDEAREWMQGLVDAAAASLRPASETHAAAVTAFLELLGTSAKGERTPAGQRAWQRVIEADGTDEVAYDLRPRGLSVDDLARIPELGGPRTRRDGVSRSRRNPPPMDATLHLRVRSVAHSGGKHPWASRLPRLRPLVVAEAAALAEPLQLATAEARAVVMAGEYAYADVDPVPPVTDRECVATAAAQTLTRRIRVFCIRVGGSWASGWGKLSLQAQDELLNPRRTLLPMLWRAAHNAQYRPGHLADAATAWDRVYGQLLTLIANLSSVHLHHPEMGQTVALLDAGGSAGAEIAAERAVIAAQGDEITDGIERTLVRRRDDRVRATLADLHEDPGGWALLEECLGALRTARLDGSPDQIPALRTLVRGLPRLRETWVAVAVAGGGADAASWDDALGYFDDSFGA